MKVKEIIAVIEEIAPLAYQESYDNSGLIIGNPEGNVTGVLCTLDITPEVIKEAIDKDANMIISHHPLIFKGIRSITGCNETEISIIEAIRNHLFIYCAHTNMDNSINGVNKLLCDKLQLQNCSILAPLPNQMIKLVTFVPEKYADEVRTALFNSGAGHIGNYDNCSFNTPGKGTYRAGENTRPFTGEKGKLHFEDEIRIECILPRYLLNRVISGILAVHPYEEVAYDIFPLENQYPLAGSGMTGYLDKPVAASDFLRMVKETLMLPVIKYSGNKEQRIHKIAVCGGSGSFLIPNVRNSGADAFLTGDIKYHQYFDARESMMICDIGHYESEQFIKELFYNLLKKKFSNFAVHLSKVVTNPINYL